MSRSSSDDDGLEHIRRLLAIARKELDEYLEGARPLRERVNRLERAERELAGGELGSTEFSDADIVAVIRDNSSAEKRIHTPRVAEIMGGNGKGFARRLKRMAERDKVIAGNAAEGYYVPGYDHGRKVPKK